MINLLPPQFKEELKKEKEWKIILNLEIIFLIFLTSFALILFSIKFYSQSQLISQKVLVNSEEKNIKDSQFYPFLEKFNLINQDIPKILSFYQKEKYPSEILENVFEIIPPSMYLTNLSWQKKDSQIILSGFCPNREVLLEFKKNLEERKEFKEIDFPLQSLIKKTDIYFTVRFKIKQ